MRATSTTARAVGWLLVGGSLALHLLTVVAFSRQPDALAAYTVMPIWVWGGLGLLLSGGAFLVLRAPLSLVVTGVWALTVLLGADEARVIANLGTKPPEPGRPETVDGIRPIRVITLNAARFHHGDPSADLAAWEPDIVLLQEAAGYRVKAIADALYRGKGDYRTFSLNGVATRWKITREVRNPDPRFHYFNHNVTIEIPDRGPIEVANIHLSTAATDLRLWQPACWRIHREHRHQRRVEMAVALRVLEVLRLSRRPARHPRGRLQRPSRRPGPTPARSRFRRRLPRRGNRLGKHFSAPGPDPAARPDPRHPPLHAGPLPGGHHPPLRPPLRGRRPAAGLRMQVPFPGSHLPSPGSQLPATISSPSERANCPQPMLLTRALQV